MLDDLKSFFTTSSVAEVGVGVTIGAAFAALIGAFTESIRSLISGDPQFGGLVQAAVVLLSVVVISLFGVVKPLMALKDRMGRVQAAKVADAVQQVRDGEAPEGQALGAGSPAQSAASGDDRARAAEMPDSSGDAVQAVDSHALDEASTSGEPLPGTAWHADPERALAAPDGRAEPSAGLPAGEPGSSAAETADNLAPAAQPYDPLFGPLPTSGTQEADPAAVTPVASTATTDGALVAGDDVSGGSEGDAPSVAGASLATAPRNAPHASTTTKVCPFCAFDIPAVATRCGWCTSDLGDLERGADPVLVET